MVACTVSQKAVGWRGRSRPWCRFACSFAPGRKSDCAPRPLLVPLLRTLWPTGTEGSGSKHPSENKRSLETVVSAGLTPEPKKAKGGSEEGSRSHGNENACSAEQRRVAESELRAPSVELLILDQIIPKKAKEGSVRLFGKTVKGTSCVVSVSDFKVNWVL